MSRGVLHERIAPVAKRAVTGTSSTVSAENSTRLGVGSIVLGAGEHQQGPDVTIVGGPQSLDIFGTRFACADRGCASPRERRPTKLLSEQIAGETREAPVSVREGMNGYEAITEAHGDFVGLMGCMLDPIPRIVDGLLHVRRNSVRIHTDILCGCTIAPGPTPYIVEHPPVQLAQNLSIENIAPARVRPLQGSADIDLLGFVQLVSQRDVGGDKIFALLGSEWRIRFIVAVE